MINFNLLYLQIALAFLAIFFLCPSLGLAVGIIIVYLFFVPFYQKDYQQIYFTVMAILLVTMIALCGN